MSAEDQWYRILVVDDQRVVVEAVKRVLEAADFEVFTALSGDGALAAIRKYGIPHLAIVDLNMPKMSGFQFCRKLHQFSDVPVIILTAADDEKTVIEGLEEHAEDYIVKPWREGEFVARVRRVLARMGDFAYTFDPVINIDDRLQINLAERHAIVDSKRLSLTPTEAKFLFLLLKNAGRTVGTEYILRRIWPLEEAFEDRLHVHIYRLRKKIEKNPKDPKYVVSDWGNGYLFPTLQ